MTPPAALQRGGQRGGGQKNGASRKVHRKEQARVRVIAENRRARRMYSLERELEAGLVLTGTEVKSLRTGQASLDQSYAGEREGELYLFNAYIGEYAQGNRANHAPRRTRKILLHRREMDRWIQAVRREGMTIAPLRLLFNERGVVKLVLALARGRKMKDMREREKERDWQRRKARLLRDKG